MIIKKLLKYKIIDYCIETLFNNIGKNININLNNNLNENLSVGQCFRYINYCNTSYKNCEILSIVESKDYLYLGFNSTIMFSYDIYYIKSIESIDKTKTDKTSLFYLPDKHVKFIK